MALFLRHMQWICITIFLVVLTGSCVSKKKYVAREKELTDQRKITQNYRLAIDSLQRSIQVLNDSIHLLDSLLEETKAKLSPKKSTKSPKKAKLTKEDERSRKVDFLLTLATTTTWPEDTLKKQFMIGIVGNPLIYEELKKKAINKKVNGKPIVVVNSVLPELPPCQILFVGHNQINDFAMIKSIVKMDSTLTVTEEVLNGFGGSHVNLYANETKVQFTLNKALLKAGVFEIQQEALKEIDK